METNNNIKNELEKFIFNLNKLSSRERRLYHYRSTINLTNGLLSLNNSETELFKRYILEYFTSVKSINGLITLETSLSLYKNYLLPVGQYLIKKKEFRTRLDIVKYILSGILFDCILLYFFNFCFTTPLFILIGFIKIRKKIKKKQFFSINW
ncbi:MAG: hypothetical protein ABR84_03455 [Cryomorphaceae bacterium BACL21 MAG-121220-bin10]|jgi:riboflavin transporter FmnP|nr:MAG: hypothetical protein ABR84_03455 [Cryomorphaceae bacterium BACL21 MAG-121220-bin10]